MFEVARAGTSGRTPTIVRTAVVLLVACAALLLVTTPARAHNVLIGSDPKDGATLATAPSRVTLTFDQAIRRDFARIAVTGPDGAHYEQGDVTVRGPSISIGVRGSGPAGAYAIGYRIVSNDGHPVTGTINFTLTGTAAGTATGTAAPPTPAGAATPSVTPNGQPATGASPAGSLAPALGAVPAMSGQAGGGWVWGLLAGTAGLLALAAFVLVRHDRRHRSAG